MCSLTLLLFAFASLLLIETKNFQENFFFSVRIDDGSVMLGGFLVESMFSDRSQLPDRFTQRKFNLFVFFGWLSL